jgi:hypothetical protein
LREKTPRRRSYDSNHIEYCQSLGAEHHPAVNNQLRRDCGTRIHGTFRLSSLLWVVTITQLKVTKAAGCMAGACCCLHAGTSRMLKFPDIGRGLGRYSLRFLGLAAVALLALSAAAGERAQALSLINPATATTAKVDADGLTMQVRGGGGHGGGGHGFGGGGGGFRGGAFHTGPVIGGGIRYGGHRRGVFVGGYFYDYPYYDYPYYYDYPSYPGCRIVLTDAGPRRICGYRPWRHAYYWRHHHRRHHRVYH